MRFLYTVGFYLIIPFVLLRLYWRGRKAPEYRQRIKERFGFLPPFVPNKPPIWLHAVSVGESIAAIPLIKKLIAQGHEVVVTCMTPTGSTQIQKTLGAQVFHVYAPYDLPGAINRFLQHTQPKLAIIMETELWPNLLHVTHQHQIPILLANARLSDRSARGYRRLGKFMGTMLNNISVVAAQSQADGARFVNLGLEKSCLNVAGNIKFDLKLAEDIIPKGQALRQSWGTDRPVWIAASTHEGEEVQVLSAFKQVLREFPDCLLVLVPRHPERFDAIANLCREHNLNVVRRSKNETIANETQIYLGDTMGELLVLYAASDLAFVGGSLVPTGGHNLIEPATLSLPIISGSYLHNFRQVSQVLTDAKACIIVNNGDELAQYVVMLLENKNERNAMGKRAQTVINQNRGALAYHLGIIKQLQQNPIL